MDITKEVYVNQKCCCFCIWSWLHILDQLGGEHSIGMGYWNRQQFWSNLLFFETPEITGTDTGERQRKCKIWDLLWRLQCTSVFWASSSSCCHSYGSVMCEESVVRGCHTSQLNGDWWQISQEDWEHCHLCLWRHTSPHSNPAHLKSQWWVCRKNNQIQTNVEGNSAKWGDRTYFFFSERIMKQFSRDNLTSEILFWWLNISPPRTLIFKLSVSSLHSANNNMIICTGITA